MAVHALSQDALLLALSVGQSHSRLHPEAAGVGRQNAERGRVICWPHRWGRWEDIIVTVTDPDEQTENNVSGQRRYCRRCGRKQIKR
jgi:hypothetical protein